MKGQKTGEPAESLKPGHNGGNILSNGGPKTFSFFIDACVFQSTLNYLHVQKLIMSDEIKECHCMICSLNLVGFLWKGKGGWNIDEHRTAKLHSERGFSL